MLCEITIENVAVIEKATAVFGSGLNVLTGETGAGKSILIDSINAILGNRTSRDIVRSGATKASIWATFTDISPAVISHLEENGYAYEGELLLYREITAAGKSNCRINGMPATASILKEICSGLINIHGQHDNQSLLNPSKHLSVLDVFAQDEKLLLEYSTWYRKLVTIKKEIDALSMDEEEKSRKLDLLRYEVDEIDAAELIEDEEEELIQQRDVVRHSQSIIKALNAAYYVLSGGDEDVGAVSLLGEAGNQMSEAARYSTDFSEMSEKINDIYYMADELALDIQDQLSSLEFGGQSIDDIEQRLDLIYRLKQKYGTSIQEILEYGENARQELENIEFSAERLAGLEKQKVSIQQEVQKNADMLTKARARAFKALSTQIKNALEFLNMPGITMAVQHQKVSFGPKGQDDLEFYISTNPGEEPKPLAKIASGGELSRIMLALKSTLADKDDIGTVIYDEIDTGVSGLAAGRIGKMLYDTAAGRQVICVTHTAQVAAFANQHLLIKKEVEEGRTYTKIGELDKAGRVDELARIISGDSITEIARANANEMLEMAAKK